MSLLLEQLVAWMATYGVTFTLCDALIFQRPRWWLTERSSVLHELFECYFCCGFWVAIGVTVFRFWALEPTELFKQALLHGFAGASFCFGLNSLFLTLESNARNPQKE